MKDDLGDIPKRQPPRSLFHQSLLDTAAMLRGSDDSLFVKYRTDPIAYAHDVLKVKLWDKQQEIVNLCAQPQDDDWHGKLAVGSGVNQGKSFCGGVLVNWFYDAWGPCIVPTTAPSQQSVVDLLWKEVRLLRGRADPKWGIGAQDFIGPAAPEMRRAPDWWAKGFVAAKGENFKGRHVERMMFIFDEAVGLPELYFRAAKTMFKPGQMLWVCFYNPTDTASTMYQEVIRLDSDWRTMELSVLDHPNVLAELKGEPPPIPAAVSLAQLESAIKDDCTPVDGDILPTDFEFPAESGKWYRPGPSFEGEHLGRWPSGDDAELWSEALWQSITKPLRWEDTRIHADELPRIGCDSGSKGADKTDTHVSWGDYSVFHESKGRQRPMAICGRLIELADEWAGKVNDARQARQPGTRLVDGREIPIKIDDDGAGGVIGDRLREQGYNVIQVGAATSASRPNRYPNKRSELWFITKDRATMGMLKLGLLPRRILDELKRQAKAPTWENNSAGQRVIEEKERTRVRLGRSPDGMDAMNLSYYVFDFRAPEVLKFQRTAITTDERQANERSENRRDGNHWGRPALRRKLFGQGRG